MDSFLEHSIPKEETRFKGLLAGLVTLIVLVVYMTAILLLVKGNKCQSHFNLVCLYFVYLYASQYIVYLS